MSDKTQQDAFKKGQEVSTKILTTHVSADYKFKEALDSLSRKNGKITWEDSNPFTTNLKDIYENFAKAMKPLDSLHNEVEKQKNEFKSQKNPAGLKAFEEGFNKAIVTSIPEKIFTHYEIIEGLNQNFQKHYIDKSPHRENTSVPANVTTQDGLFKHLLENNRGLALGDQHTQREMLDYMSKNMKTAKALGVDTIYIEDDGSMEKYGRLSVEKMDYELSRLDNKTILKNRASIYGDPNPDNNVRAELEMFREAARHGINVINVDSRTGGNNVVSNKMQYRVTTTNFEWAGKIEHDRKGKSGKFLVFGGAAHFANTAGEENGLVDDALGIPTMVFNKSNTEDGRFHRGFGETDGVDFYLHGGPDFRTILNGREVNLEKEFMEMPPKAVKVNPIDLPQNNSEKENLR